MSPEAILTVVTVVLAVLALIPEERGLDLRLRISGGSRIMLVAASALVVYWALLEPLHSLPWLKNLPRGIPWIPGWDPSSSSLAALLLVTGYCLWRYRRPIPISRLGSLLSALELTIARRRFGEVLHLLESHLPVISNCLEGSYWQLALRKRLLPTPGEEYVMALAMTPRAEKKENEASADAEDSSDPAGDTFTITFPHIPKPSWLVDAISTRVDQPKRNAEHIARSLGLSRDLVYHIAANHPYLGISISRLQSSWILREFTETFSLALFSDPDSILFRELRRAENLDSRGFLSIEPETQPLLAALCEDADRSNGPQLIYTYLHACESFLGPAASAESLDSLNRPIGDFYERGRWSSPHFASVYLYSIVAPRNAVSTAAPVLNLYGLNSLSRLLLDALEPRKDVDALREWPTPIHYLLYEIVSLLVDTVVIWRERPDELPADKLSHLIDGKPHILPAHAIEVLGSVMYEVLKTDKLDGRFKGYLLEVWWRAYWEKYKSPWTQTEAVLEGLVRGGGFVGKGMAHRDGVADALRSVDMIMRVTEGGDRICDAFSLPRQGPS